MVDTLSKSLDTLASQVRVWLTPTVEADCPRAEAVKLRMFLRNLENAAAQARVQEEGLIDADHSLAATMEGLAESFAKWPDGVTLGRQAIQSFVGVFNEAAAHAWALEMALRLHAGAIAEAEIDIETLALARKLVVGGVIRGSRIGHSPPFNGGDAA